VAKEEVRSCLAYNHQLISKRYNEIFFMIDTCQANTMYTKFYSPNILATGSSRIRENSYSVSRRLCHSKSNVNDARQYENDDDVGVSVIDSYTHFVLEYLESINKTSATSMKDLVSVQTAFSEFSFDGVYAVRQV
jgi:GPI-anchor transamidase subunit K